MSTEPTPRSVDLSEAVARFWCDVLDVDDVENEQDFFAAGGQSIGALRLVARIRDELGIRLTFDELLEHRTIADQVRLLTKRSPSKVATGVRRESAPALGVGQPLPMSEGQQRLWVLDQLQPDSVAYNVTFGMHLVGDVDVGVLHRAYCAVVARHPTLASVIRAARGHPQVQYEPSLAHAGVILLDLRSLPDNVAAVVWAESCALEIRRPVRMSGGALCRLVLGVVGEQAVEVQVCVHHAAIDRWSVGVMIADWAEAYNALRRGEHPTFTSVPHAYLEYVGLSLDEPAKYEAAFATRMARLQGVPELTLPSSGPVRKGPRFLEHVSSPFSERVLRKLGSAASDDAYTPFVKLFAAFGIALGRVSGCSWFGLGTPVVNRPTIASERGVGYFANTLVLVCDLRGNPTVSEVLRRVRAEVLEGVCAQHVPFSRVVEALESAKRGSETSLFKVLVTYEEAAASVPVFDSLSVSIEPQMPVEAQAELSLLISTRGAVLSFDTTRVSPEMAERVAQAFTWALQAVLEEPHRRLAELSLFGPALEQRWLDLGMAHVEYESGTGVLEGLEQQTRERPDAVAFVSAEQHLTYAGMSARVQAWAASLSRLGVGPGCRVAISLPRGPDLVLAMLAILSCGAAYVPLDPSHPRVRQKLALEDAQPTLCLVSEGEGEALWRCVAIESLGRSGAFDRVLVGPAAEAYVMYTSGSSGAPKGVVVGRGQLDHFIGSVDSVLEPAPGDRWYSVTSQAFDISVLELLWTISRGATVVFPSTHGREPHVDIGLFYFAGHTQKAPSGDVYKLLLEGARRGDELGLVAVWTPERHFHEFGGAYAEPAVTAAAVAMTTRRIQVRAGSVVLPLNDPVRVVERWAMVDRLSNGRVAMAFASGWHPADFCLAPDHYMSRKETLFEQIEEARRLWNGESVLRQGPDGASREIRTLPRPVQPELPLWVTAAGDPETFRRAGEIGANLLTHLLGQSYEDVASKVALYREARRLAGRDAATGRVALMLHTFVGDSEEHVRKAAFAPLGEYLQSSVDLWSELMRTAEDTSERLSGQDRADLVDWAVQRFMRERGLFGTVDQVAGKLARISTLGIDEVACLVDFGVEESEALRGIEALGQLQTLLRPGSSPPLVDLPYDIVLHGVTHLQLTPALLGASLDAMASSDALSVLSTMLVGGAALPSTLARRVLGAFHGRLLNMYGPTEATVWVSSSNVTPLAAQPTVELGVPFGDTEVYILGPHAELCPLGTVGELCIGGSSVAQGYAGRPALTAERFVPNPYATEPGARMYCTGDRVLRDRDERLVFLGRYDDQVKIRGWRVELGEVRAALESLPWVSAAACVCRGDDLVAFVCLSEGATSRDSEERVRTALRRQLPEPMVPTRVHCLDRLPMNANGKVDAGRLLDVDAVAAKGDATDSGVAVRVGTEQLVADVFSQVVGREVDRSDASFFHLGGNSLSALTTTFHLRERTGVSIPLRTIFEAQTVRGVASLIDAVRRVKNTGPGRAEGLHAEIEL